jgi:hypothetical protein
MQKVLLFYAKSATFLCKKWWNKHVPWLAIALAIWYNMRKGQSQVYENTETMLV